MLTVRPHPENRWRERIIGLDERLPLLDGRLAPYINLDNAASTPPLRDVSTRCTAFCPTTRVSTGARASNRVSAPRRMTKRTTRSRASSAPTRGQNGHLREEHDRSDQQARLPLSAAARTASCSRPRWSTTRTICPGAGARRSFSAASPADGRLDEDDVDRLLADYGDRIALLTVSGASNVTGFLQPIHRLARKAHAVGARILVDAAQLAAHRRIDVKPDDDPEHLDYVVLSAHKMYAPFGTGALVGLPRHLPARRAGVSGRRHGRDRHARRTCTGQACPIARKPAVPTSSAPWRWRWRHRR